MPTRDEIEKVADAAYVYVETMVPRADITHPYPAWHGWALRESFIAGVHHANKSHPYGTLKPLEWVDYGGFSRSVNHSGDEYTVWNEPGHELGIHWYRGSREYGSASCADLADGKRLCQLAHAAEMAKAFTPIGVQP